MSRGGRASADEHALWHGVSVMSVQGSVADSFPEDLSGHFWAVLSHEGDLERWRFSIHDYQNNVMLTGLASTEQQAARIVRAWDAIVVSDFEGNDDPSLPFSETDE